MKNRLAPVFLFYTLLLGIACDQVLRAPAPEEEDFLTAYALLPAGDTASTILVDRTFNYAEPGDPDRSSLAGPAQVSLWKDGQWLTDFQQRGASIYYEGRHAPLTDTAAVYRLAVSHPDFESMEAFCSLPRLATGFSAELLRDYALPDGEVLDRAMAVTFFDPAPPGDRYEIGVRFPLDVSPDTVWFPVRTTPLELSAGGRPLVPNAFFRYGLTGSWFLDDEDLAGEAVRIVFELQQAIGDERLFTVYLRNLSREHFAYARFLADEALGLPESFTQYPDLISNFDNGIGLFAIYREQRVEVPQ